MAFVRRNTALLVTAAIVILVLLWLNSQYKIEVTVSIILSGLTLGALYFLVTSGLSLIFGLMDVLNFAHGLFFMLGAYMGYTLYANPRMILNTLPFALALGGGIAVGGWIAPLLGRVRVTELERVVSFGFIAVGGVLTLAAVWGFDLLSLAANAATSSGGEIPTEQAQEPAEHYILRVILLTGAGLLLGIGLARYQTMQRRGKPASWLSVLGGLAAVAIGFTLIYVRTPGETFVLGLSSNWRFVLALVFGALSGAGLGALVEWGMIRPLYSRPIYQVLMTLGLVFAGQEVIKGIWGQTGFFMTMPTYFSTPAKVKGACPSPDIISWFGNHCASINVLGQPFPSYRMFIIALGVVIFVAVLLLLQRTRMGMIIRAGVQDSEMVQALGINVRRVFTLVFALGTGLAALGGVAAAPFLGVNLGLGQEFLLLAFIAVVIGGMGSFTGAAVGALLVGLARAVGDQIGLKGIQFPLMDAPMHFSPTVASASTVLLMAIVLLIRPVGLLGRRE